MYGAEATDRETQRSQMKRRRRCCVALVATILGYLLTNGHLGALVVSVVILSLSLLLEPSPLVREQQWMREPPQQEVSNHGYEKIFKKNWTQPNVQATKAPSKRSEPYAPISSPTVEVNGGVDLWISLSKRMHQLQQQQVQLVEAAVRHKRKEERAIEIGKSISQLPMRLTNTAKESESKVPDEKSLDFADDETKMAYQGAAAKRVAEIAEAARTMRACR